MNLGEIKAFLRDKPAQANPNQEVNQQLREIGLRQAAQGVSSQSSISVVSSQTTVGLRIYSNSLNQSIELNSKRPEFTPPEKKQTSLFDFEEVAKNVLRFVGGAINHAAAKGADKEALMDMFEQARSGVLKGIEMAEKDLAGFMNDEIEQGIASSKELIDQGIERLERKLFGKDEEDAKAASLGVYESASYSREDSGDLTIRTRDGDEVSIRFEDFQEFEINRSRLIEFETIQPVAPFPVTPDDAPVTDDTPQAPQASEQESAPTAGPQSVNSDAQVATSGENEQEADTAEQNSSTSTRITAEQNYQFYESSSLSFSVRGELDEDELKAIGDLVADASDLADEFFNGDIETAFKQALEIGFDEKELTGFALNLTRQEKVEVVQAYEFVSHYNDEVTGGDNPAKAAKPIAQYLERMLNVMEQSKQKLEDNNAYEEMLNGIVNQVRDVQTTDLISAINRFHSFNKMLLENIPVAANPETNS